jgi:hypothetical protein
LSTSCRILISVARRRRDALGTTWQKGTVREDLDFVRSGVERTIACRFKGAQPTPAPRQIESRTMQNPDRTGRAVSVGRTLAPGISVSRSPDSLWRFGYTVPR